MNSLNKKHIENWEKEQEKIFPKRFNADCAVGQRVYYFTDSTKCEGILIKWQNSYWADVELDDGTMVVIGFPGWGR